MCMERLAFSPAFSEQVIMLFRKSTPAKRAHGNRCWPGSFRLCTFVNLVMIGPSHILCGFGNTDRYADSSVSEHFLAVSAEMVSATGYVSLIKVKASWRWKWLCWGLLACGYVARALATKSLGDDTPAVASCMFWVAATRSLEPGVGSRIRWVDSIKRPNPEDR